MNDLPGNILNSFIDIFADNSTLYSSSSSTLNLASVTKNLIYYCELGVRSGSLQCCQNKICEFLSSQRSSNSHHSNVTGISLWYRYFHGKCSDELQFIISPLRVFQRQTRYSNACAKQTRFLQIPITNFMMQASSHEPQNYGTHYC